MTSERRPRRKADPSVLEERLDNWVERIRAEIVTLKADVTGELAGVRKELKGLNGSVADTKRELADMQQGEKVRGAHAQGRAEGRASIEKRDMAILGAVLSGVIAAPYYLPVVAEVLKGVLP